MENLYEHHDDSPEKTDLEKPLMLPVRASLAMRPWVVYGPLCVQWMVPNFPILCGLGYWSPNRFFYVSILVFAGGFLIWMLIGIPILAGVPSLLLNYVTKVAAFAAVTSLYFKNEVQVLPKPLEAVQRLR